MTVQVQVQQFLRIAKQQWKQIWPAFLRSGRNMRAPTDDKFHCNLALYRTFTLEILHREEGEFLKLDWHYPTLGTWILLELKLFCMALAIDLYCQIKFDDTPSRNENIETNLRNCDTILEIQSNFVGARWLYIKELDLEASTSLTFTYIHLKRLHSHGYSSNSLESRAPVQRKRNLNSVQILSTRYELTKGSGSFSAVTACSEEHQSPKTSLEVSMNAIKYIVH